MTGIILVALLNVAMFAWFFYLFSKDPANLWKRRRPDGNANERETGDSAKPEA